MLSKNQYIFICSIKSFDILSLLIENIEKYDVENAVVFHCFQMKRKSLHLKYISESQMNELLNIIYLYDFSDKVIVISDSSQYGGLLNYVKTGLLTKRELIDALLYKIKM